MSFNYCHAVLCCAARAARGLLSNATTFTVDEALQCAKALHRAHDKGRKITQLCFHHTHSC